MSPEASDVSWSRLGTSSNLFTHVHSSVSFPFLFNKPMVSDLVVSFLRALSCPLSSTISALHGEVVFPVRAAANGQPPVLFQGLVTIKDVSLCFSQEEWRSLDPSQTDFYGEYVMQENCGIVVSLSKQDLKYPRRMGLPASRCWKLLA